MAVRLSSAMRELLALMRARPEVRILRGPTDHPWAIRGPVDVEGRFVGSQQFHWGTVKGLRDRGLIADEGDGFAFTRDLGAK